MALVMTLTSPHQRPPLPTHPSLHRVWAPKGTGTPAVPVISLSGDYNDTQVSAILTRLQGELLIVVLCASIVWAVHQHVFGSLNLEGETCRPLLFSAT